MWRSRRGFVEELVAPQLCSRAPLVAGSHHRLPSYDVVDALFWPSTYAHARHAVSECAGWDEAAINLSAVVELELQCEGGGFHDVKNCGGAGSNVVALTLVYPRSTSKSNDSLTSTATNLGRSLRRCSDSRQKRSAPSMSIFRRRGTPCLSMRVAQVNCGTSTMSQPAGLFLIATSEHLFFGSWLGWMLRQRRAK